MRAPSAPDNMEDAGPEGHFSRRLGFPRSRSRRRFRDPPRPVPARPQTDCSQTRPGDLAKAGRHTSIGAIGLPRRVGKLVWASAISSTHTPRKLFARSRGNPYLRLR